METRGPSGGRIVIDPDDLRDVAVRLRRAAVTYSSVARRLVTRPLPVMPAHVTSAVGDAVTKVHRELQELAFDLLDEAASLVTRATWTELGEAGDPGWLVPGLRHVLPSADAPGDLTDPSPSGTGRVPPTEQWALELLDQMQTSVEDTHDPSARNPLEGLVNEVEQLVGEYGGEVPENGSERFTLLADLPAAASELSNVTMEPAEAGAGRTVADGALAIGSAVFSAAPTGAGLGGCLLVGAGSDFFDEIRTGDDVFDE